MVLLAVDVHALQITEIMYNPDGSDDGREWIEIYNDGSEVLNLSGMKFFESGTNHRTKLINGEISLDSGEFALVIDSDEFFIDYPEFETSNIAIFDSSFSLSNKGEYLAIKFDDVIADVNYTDDADEGYSLSLYDFGWNMSNEIGGSPGEINDVKWDDEIIPEEIDSCCDINMDIEIDKMLFQNRETIKYKHRLSNLYNDQKYDYIIEYWIEDLFGNIIRARRNTTNVNKKSWTPNIDEMISVAVLKARIYPGCNDTDSANNYDEQLVVIRNDKIDDIIHDICNVSFDIFVEKSVFNNKEAIKYKHLVDGAENFSIEYWIEDIDRKIVKSKRVTTNTNKKSYTPNIKEKEKAFLLRAIISSQCDDVSVERFIVVRNEDYEEEILNKISNKISEDMIEHKEIDYRIERLPVDVKQNSSLEFKVKIINDDEKHLFRLYSYVYSGKKCVSDGGNRTYNERFIDVSAGEIIDIDMSNFISDSKLGDYKLKVMIHKDDQKTGKQLIQHIIVKEAETIEVANISQHIKLNSRPQFFFPENFSSTLIKPTSRIIYEGKDMKIKNSISHYMIGFLSLSLILSTGKWGVG